ncbi:hypothetical protein Tco_0659751 [Tanacetum coccineum]
MAYDKEFQSSRGQRGRGQPIVDTHIVEWPWWVIGVAPVVVGAGLVSEGVVWRTRLLVCGACADYPRSSELGGLSLKRSALVQADVCLECRKRVSDSTKYWRSTVYPLCAFPFRWLQVVILRPPGAKVKSGL